MNAEVIPHTGRIHLIASERSSQHCACIRRIFFFTNGKNLRSMNPRSLSAPFSDRRQFVPSVWVVTTEAPARLTSAEAAQVMVGDEVLRNGSSHTVNPRISGDPSVVAGPFFRPVKYRGRILILIGLGGTCPPQEMYSHVYILLWFLTRLSSGIKGCRVVFAAQHMELLEAARLSSAGGFGPNECRNPSKKGTVECRVECSFAAYSETSHSIAKGLPHRFHGSHKSATDLNIAP